MGKFLASLVISVAILGFVVYLTVGGYEGMPDAMAGAEETRQKAVELNIIKE